MLLKEATSYRVFGGVLRTTLWFPELHTAPEGSLETWTLTVREAPAPETNLPEIVRRELQDGSIVRMHRSASGASRLEYSDTGTFDISASGGQIDWYPAASAPVERARTDVLGSVLALAAHVDGLQMLHASAVAVNGTVLGFLAPKFHGKSTLACAITDVGAHLVTDDALAVRVDETVECAPGVPAIRLRSGSAAHLRGLVTDDADNEWRHLERRSIDEVASDWLPLGALYALDPRAPDEMSEPVRRYRLPPQTAAMALIHSNKLGSLVCGSLAVESLGRVTDIVSRVPVYVLKYARDLARLNEVATTVVSWHSLEGSNGAREQ